MIKKRGRPRKINSSSSSSSSSSASSSSSSSSSQSSSSISSSFSTEQAIIETPFYRTTTLGKSLTKSLNTLITSKKLTLAQARQIQQHFDQSIIPVMKEAQVEATRDLIKDDVLSNRKRRKGDEHKLSGELDSYNNLYSSWKIDVVNAQLTAGSRTIKIPRARFLFSAEAKKKEKKKDLLGSAAREDS